MVCAELLSRCALLQAAKAAALEDQEEEEGLSAAQASYNYLLSMAIYNLTWEKVHQLEQEADYQVCAHAGVECGHAGIAHACNRD